MATEDTIPDIDEGRSTTPPYVFRLLNNCPIPLKERNQTSVLTKR